MDQSLGNMCVMRDNNGLAIAVLNLSKNNKGRSSSCAVGANKKAFIKRKKQKTCLMSVNCQMLSQKQPTVLLQPKDISQPARNHHNDTQAVTQIICWRSQTFCR